VIQIFGTPKCKGTRAAQRFFADRGIKVHSIDIKEKALSKGELASIARSTGGFHSLLDSTGPRIKERGLQHSAPNEERLLQLFLQDPLLLKTPIVRLGQRAVVGLDEAGWKQLAEALKAAG
jgi:arsenate reductase (glutaredoxin)